MEFARLDETFFGAGIRPKLGDLLVHRGLISAGQLGEALAAKSPDERLGETLIRLGLAHEYDVARTLAGQLGLEFLDLHASGVDTDVARLIPPDVAQAELAVAIRKNHDGTVTVAAADPTDIAVDRFEAMLGRPVRVKVAELSAVRNALRLAYAA